MHLNFEANQKPTAFWEWGIGKQSMPQKKSFCKDSMLRIMSNLEIGYELRNPVFSKNRVSGLLMPPRNSCQLIFFTKTSVKLLILGIV